MHTHNTSGTSRSKIKTFIHRDTGLPAKTWNTEPALLTREDLRHLVAAMVD